MFDMYIEPEHRGLALSSSLFRMAFRGLRARGVVKVKGYYVVDNLPALWMHRVMGYREMGRVRVQQILGLTWRYSYTPLNKVEARS
jgi:GNAT superfamily N-acetyltransferase